MTDTTFKVPEMHCGHCKVAIEDELNRPHRNVWDA
jgi:copper chaperone CopZ